MKLKNFLVAFTLSSFIIGFSSCKKDNNSNGTSAELETTFELSGDQAISDNLTEDANDILMESAVSNNFAGNRPSATAEFPITANELKGATVTVSQGFPKNVTIDFRAGTTSGNGVLRKGKINITISDSIRKTGSIAVMTFDNYYVNTFKKEGTITWTNTTSQPGTKSWERKCENGKITAADGKYWLHSGIRQIVQTEGVSTPLNLLDDTYSITGAHTVTNQAGDSRTSTILEALIKSTSCDNISQGKIQIAGPNHTATIDFGNGACDKLATISIDGYTARTILLK